MLTIKLVAVLSQLSKKNNNKQNKPTYKSLNLFKMAKLNQSEVNVNWILVLILGFFGPIGAFINSKILMKMENAWLGYTIFAFIPLLNLLCWIDLALKAKKLQEEGSIDEYDHVLEFLGGLPLMHE